MLARDVGLARNECWFCWLLWFVVVVGCGSAALVVSYALLNVQLLYGNTRSISQCKHTGRPPVIQPSICRFLPRCLTRCSRCSTLLPSFSPVR